MIARSSGHYRNARIITTLLLVAGFSATGSLGAVGQDALGHRQLSEPLERLSADFQSAQSLAGPPGPPPGSVITNVPAQPNGAGGEVAYEKVLEVPRDLDVLYITFSAQGVTNFGSALLMTALVNGALCQPAAGGPAPLSGGHQQFGWFTLLHLPEPTTSTGNCNDGGEGGTAKCASNTIYFSCCARIDTDDVAVQIKLANNPGGNGNVSAYDSASIYIDGQKDAKGTRCTGVSSPIAR
jgi:hypothetical protein